MKESYSVEQVRNVPSVEIARNVARVARLDFALDENRQMDGRTRSDWGSEDGRLIVMMADRNVSLDDLPADRSYDLGVLFALQTYEFKYALDRLPKEIEKIQKNPVVDQVTVQRALTMDGYERVGDIFEGTRDRLIPRIGAYAARAYLRGNIKKELDRSLYERADEIDAALQTIETAAPIRTRTIYYHTDPVTTQEVSVFRDFEAHEDTEWWWSELKTDQTAIDAAAEVILQRPVAAELVLRSGLPYK